jgi:2-succinyl-5-enolpyruvyl-6-hydroxy-3-cyclohexene-1-carboxylate synthase
VTDPRHAHQSAADDTATTTATFCATLVDELARAGVTDAVISPGSRSTPMALALAADDRLNIHVHHDERAAAFIALGLGLAAGRPAVVLTTSGTAAVELHPAIVEAHHAKVPLLAITADRPPELQNVGAPQTIDQTHLFGDAVRAFHEPGVPTEDMRHQWRSLAAQAVLDTMGAPRGPVHLNLAFREPLVGRPDHLPAGRSRGGPWHGRAGPRPEAAAIDAGAIADAVQGRRGVIIAGGGIENPEPVHALAAALHWPVIADPRSGCRLTRPATISHFDAILRVPEQARLLDPEVILRLGSLPASKVLTQWLAASGAWQLGIETDGSRFDPDHSLASILAVEPGAFCARLLGELDLDRSSAPPPPDRWYDRWTAVDAEAASAIRETLARHHEPTEPAIARDVVAALPAGSRLVVSSSMPIRDVEWFAAPREGLTIHANRGANGIDGVVSTAVGVALAARVPTGVLVGDIAFLHDTNALLGATSRGIDLVIVVIDNDGGGIFSFLPQATSLDPARFEQLFGTPHGVDPAAIAAAHGVTVTRVESQDEVAGAVSSAAAKGGVHAVIVKTDRDANVAIHRDLNAAVATALAPHA